MTTIEEYFFALSDAEDFADTLRVQGYQVSVEWDVQARKWHVKAQK